MESKNDLQQPISTLQTIILGRYTDQQLLQALQLLHKILTNIVKNPTEPKFKSIRTTNPTLQQKLFFVKEMGELLTQIGFTLIDDHYVFIGDEYSLIDKFSQLVQGQIDIIAERNMTNEEKEELAKKKYLEERQKQIEAEFKRKQEEERKLKELMELDKKEQAQREKPKDSVAQQTKFGCTTKTWKDLGVDLNARR